MKMLITEKWLRSMDACKDGFEWSTKQKGIKEGIEVKKFLKMLVDDNHWPWANWVIVRIMTRPQYLDYAIFSAEQVIKIYEKKYPNNKAPREAIEAIEAAKAVLKNDTQENREIAYVKRRDAAAYAAYAADAAAYAADAADAADAAAYAADAADAAAYAADAAYAAADAAAYAAYAADAAYAAADAAAARDKMRAEILKYGILLLKD